MCVANPTGHVLARVAKQDLLNLPSDLVQELLRMYHHAELTAEWPVQALVGLIASLAKRADASEVHHFRPITVFSLFYRLYASIRAKQVLAFLAPDLPDTLFGCVPGKATANLWFGMQLDIEELFVTPIIHSFVVTTPEFQGTTGEAVGNRGHR